jgi:HPt (histidine-containing phosphotransfer) domain-containing protein
VAQRSLITDNGLSPHTAEGQSHWTLPDMLLDLAADGNPDLIADLMDAFQTDTQLRLKQLHDALADADRNGIHAGIHSIKGGSLQMGAEAMASMCLDIELAVGESTAPQLSQRLRGLEAEFEEVCHAMAAYSNVRPVCETDKSIANTSGRRSGPHILGVQEAIRKN